MIKRLLTATLLLWAFTVNAGTFSIESSSTTGAKYLFYYANVTEGDNLELDEIMLMLEEDPMWSGKMFIQGPGGMHETALAIMQTVKEYKIDTIVWHENKCLSACALIWAAGENKVVGENAKIGFHFPYIPLSVSSDNPYQKYLELNGWPETISAIEWSVFDSLATYYDIFGDTIKDWAAFMRGYIETTREKFWYVSKFEMEKIFTNVTFRELPKTE